MPHGRDDRRGTLINLELHVGELVDRVAVVTGGGRGIGRAIAQALADAGAAVAVIGRTAAPLEECAAAIIAAGGRALALSADVIDRAAVERRIRETEQRLGPVDLLVNNAGLLTTLGPFWETDPDEYWRMFEVNLRGALLCSHAVVPGMVARGTGRIINVASGAGVRPFPYHSGYATSKAALLRLTEHQAAELAPHGVAVFAINPGLVYTAMPERFWGPEGRRWLDWTRGAYEERAIPPERAAQLCVYLASGRADGLSGRYIDVYKDIEELVQRVADVRERDLFTLRMLTE
jgi:NAD(P)-dependent dehydrogenase (short-subunit alcohol dehydrogenase family)